MGILMVAYRRVWGYPIILAANRDEFLDRPVQGPDLLGSHPAIWGGRDVRAGRTWLGVNAHGFVFRRAALQDRFYNTANVSISKPYYHILEEVCRDNEIGV